MFGKFYGLFEGYKSEFGLMIKELKDEWFVECECFSKVMFKWEVFDLEIKYYFF